MKTMLHCESCGELMAVYGSHPEGFSRTCSACSRDNGPRTDSRMDPRQRDPEDADQQYHGLSIEDLYYDHD